MKIRATSYGHLLGAERFLIIYIDPIRLKWNLDWV